MTKLETKIKTKIIFLSFVLLRKTTEAIFVEVLLTVLFQFLSKLLL